jgi:hypothetical protein
MFALDCQILAGQALGADGPIPPIDGPAESDRGALFAERRAKNGQVAQLVEQRTENPCVGGSIPPLSTS